MVEKISLFCRRAFPTEETRPVCRKFQEQVSPPLSRTPKLDSEALPLTLQQVVRFLNDDGKYKESEELDEQSFRILRGVLGERHPDALCAMVNLAQTYRNQGRWDESVMLQKKCWTWQRGCWASGIGAH
jgi:Tetratricopeptide repeat